MRFSSLAGGMTHSQYHVGSRDSLCCFRVFLSHLGQFLHMPVLMYLAEDSRDPSAALWRAE